MNNIKKNVTDFTIYHGLNRHTRVLKKSIRKGFNYIESNSIYEDMLTILFDKKKDKQTGNKVFTT